MSIAMPPLGTAGVLLLPVHLSGQYTASAAGVCRYRLPCRTTLLGVSVGARASGGITPTLTVDLKAGGTSLLAAPVAVTAGAVAEAAIATPDLADEAVLTVDLTIGGTTPTWDDIDLLLTVCRV